MSGIEQDFHPGRIDKSTAARIGKMLGAKLLVIGSLKDSGKDLFGNISGKLRVKIIHAETGEIVSEIVAGGNSVNASSSISKMIAEKLGR